MSMKELNMDDLNEVSGGTGLSSSIESDYACPKCGGELVRPHGSAPSGMRV